MDTQIPDVTTDAEETAKNRRRPGGAFGPRLQAVLESLHESLREERSGALVEYIPELAHANPELFGIAVVTVEGDVYAVGDTEELFTIQSISKPFAYGLALETRGPEHVLARVGVEPTGDAFNSIVLDQVSRRPYNPMVNAGAIAVTDMIPGRTLTDRLVLLLECFRRYAGHDALAVDPTTFSSERATGHRNRAIAHLMRAYDMMSDLLEESLDLYFQQCAILVTARDLAAMAATFAKGGVNPLTGVRAVAEAHVTQILSVMYTCGMYDSAGEWAYRVGLPAKSGVSGGILAVVPGEGGIAVFSPRVDAHGNSVRGIRVCEALSREFGLHLFDPRRFR
jgi:glutaminase